MVHKGEDVCGIEGGGEQVYKIKPEELQIRGENPLLDAIVFRIATQHCIK